MKKLFISLLLSASFSPTCASAKVRYHVFGPGKVMAYEWTGQSNKNPTLILLPGVNRALFAAENAPQALMKKGWNILLPSLPSHPASIAGLGQFETPYFLLSKSDTVETYAQDLSDLVKNLKIKTAIPVSLSYSAGISAHLNSELFPHVIDTVPLVTSNETNPQLETWMQQLKTAAAMNPLSGQFWLRATLDQAYYTNWTKTVTNNSLSHPGFYGANPRVHDIISGYVAIARAVENFDFTAKDFSTDAQTRDFVLAGNEEPLRLKKQIQVIKNYVQSGKKCRVVVVENSGHILPSDQPELYTLTVDVLVRGKGRSLFQFRRIEQASDYTKTSWEDLQAFETWAASK